MFVLAALDYSPIQMTPSHLASIVVSLSVSVSVLGCAAETGEPDANVPTVATPAKAAPDEQGKTVDVAANGRLSHPIDPGGSPDWGCGANHNRRLVRI
jgi:hypothetical protein